MKPHRSICQHDQWDAFLNGQLTPGDEQLLLEHLNICDNCRHRLDESAATPDSWNAAHTFLRDDALDHNLLSSSGDVHSTADEDLAASPQIKHVINILNPTDNPAMLGRLGGDEVTGVVGAGGMGVVLKAFEPVKHDERLFDETPEVSPFDSSKLYDWDDQLDPVLQDIEQKLSEVLQTD